MNQSHDIGKTKQKYMVETQYFRYIIMVNFIDGVYQENAADLKLMP
jgi:hypothetical protein